MITDYEELLQRADFGRFCGQNIVYDLRKSPRYKHIPPGKKLIDEKICDLIMLCKKKNTTNSIKNEALRITPSFVIASSLTSNAKFIATPDILNMLPVCTMILNSAPM